MYYMHYPLPVLPVNFNTTLDQTTRKANKKDIPHLYTTLHHYKTTRHNTERQRSTSVSQTRQLARLCPQRLIAALDICCHKYFFCSETVSGVERVLNPFLNASWYRVKWSLHTVPYPRSPLPCWLAPGWAHCTAKTERRASAKRRPQAFSPVGSPLGQDLKETKLRFKKKTKNACLD